MGRKKPVSQKLRLFLLLPLLLSGCSAFAEKQKDHPPMACVASNNQPVLYCWEVKVNR